MIGLAIFLGVTLTACAGNKQQSSSINKNYAERSTTGTGDNGVYDTPEAHAPEGYDRVVIDGVAFNVPSEELDFERDDDPGDVDAAWDSTFLYQSPYDGVSRPAIRITISRVSSSADDYNADSCSSIKISGADVAKVCRFGQSNVWPGYLVQTVVGVGGGAVVIVYDTDSPDPQIWGEIDGHLDRLDPVVVSQ